MPRLTLISLLCAAGLSAACSDSPKCPSGKQRVGSRCVVGSACLVDADGDGYGVPSTSACIPDVLPGDCDDQAPQRYPDAAELCADGVDNNCDGVVDEPHPETCNDLDDDCDGTVDNGVLSAFYPDTDGDGFGHGEPVLGCAAPAGYTAAHGDCDDANQHVHPDAGEVCDGQDSNCDERADESFECAQNAAVSCTTVCGSTGTGTCSSGCELPSPDVCKIPEEACNLRDDDCDGLADEGVIGPVAHTLHTLPMPDMKSLVVASFPRTEGGAWLVHLPAGDESALQLHAIALDARGRAIGPSTAIADLGALSIGAVADGNDEWLAVATAHSEPSGSTAGPTKFLRVQLFESKALDERLPAPIAELEFEHTIGDDLSTMPIRLSLLEDAQGELHALMVYSAVRPAEPDGPSRVSSLQMRVLKLESQGWRAGSAQTLAENIGIPFNVEVARVPCRDEWVVANGLGPAPSLRRVSLDGQFVGAVADSPRLEGVARLSGFRAAPARCDREDPELALGVFEKDRPALVRRWRVDRSTGALRRAGELELGPGVMQLALAHWGNRWFVGAAAATVGEMPAPAPVYLAELIFDGTPNVRSIPVGQGKHAATPGAFSPLLILADQPRTGLLHTGEALLFSVPDDLQLESGSNLDALHQAASPGSTESVVAATYTVGCP